MGTYAKLGLLLGLLVVAALPMSQALAEPENSKLVAMPVFGDVMGSTISPDGVYVVYRADQDTDEVFELYSVPLSGGASVKLSAPLVDGGNVTAFQISPDSSRVVYRADQDTDEVDELYSVPITGGVPAKLNAALVPGGEIGSFTISPDSSRVVYRADQDTDNVVELYSVPIAGPASASVKLNGELVEGGNVMHDFQISPDSSRVVYRADQNTDNSDELFSVPIVGPASAGVKLNHDSFFAIDDVDDFEISPDGSTVVYRASWYHTWYINPWWYSDYVHELYRVPIDGGLVVKLVHFTVEFMDVYYYRISPDNTRVVYAANGTTAIAGTSRVLELYSMPLEGPTGFCYGPPIDVCQLTEETKLNGDLVEGGDVMWAFKISPDGSRVVYRADQDTDGVYELYSVPIAGGASVKLNGELVEGGDVKHDFQISPDGSRVVYRADQDTDDISELYGVPVDGPASAGIKLTGTLVPDGYVFPDTVQISPDSSHVLYQALPDTWDVLELYGVPIAGPASEGFKLNGELVPGGRVETQAFEISPDSSRVVYKADQDTDDVYELYVTLFGAPGDRDDDGVLDPDDNCPDDPNPDQENYDGDALGDVCDPDDDNDTVADGEDTDPLNEFACRDVDTDTCDDCSVLGVADPSNDGTDTDADGACDAGDPDDDDDGIADEVDSDPLTPSTAFSDEGLGGTTYGEILDQGGLTVEVAEEPNPDGVRIVPSGTGGPATVSVCSIVTLFLDAGDDAVVTCGSATVQVFVGPVTANFGSFVGTFPSDTTATVTETAPGAFEVANSAQSAGPIVVNGIEIAPGATESDDDGDGFFTSVEQYLGTDALDACPDGPSDDAWPLDINIDGQVSVVADVLNFRGRIGATPGAPNWWQRLDLNTDGEITVVGDVLLYRGMIGQTCT